MKVLQGAAAFLLSASVIQAPAYAVDYRWTKGLGQGVLEAIIDNASGASLNIYCPSGQEDTTPGMILQSDKVHPRKGERIDVQIVVDGENHAFYFDDIEFRASGRYNLTDFRSLIEALVGSKSKKFIVEFPKFGSSEEFSLLGAKKALVSADDFLDGCE